MNRKNFIRGLGLGALGTFTLPSLQASSRKPRTSVPLPVYDPQHDTAFWRAVRAQFPLLDDPLYLNTGGLGPASQPVLDKTIATMLQLQEHSEVGHELLDLARETMADFLGVKPEEVCFTRNATEGNSIIAAGLKLQPGDEVIFETHAHPGGSFPWINQAKLRGVKVQLFDPDPASPEGNLARIRELITRRTKVIQVSHITCTTGLVFPVRAIADLAHQHGIWFHIDGAQSVGMINVNLDAIGCDSYAFSGHKWLGAPHETGVLYLRHDKLEEVAVTAIGSHAGELPYLPGEIELYNIAARHEYGTRSAGLIVGQAEAVRFQEQIGRDRIAAHGRGLATMLRDAFSEIPNIEVLTPRHDEMRASITTIHHTRANAGELFEYLRKHHGLRCRPVTEQGLQAVRISTHVFNSHADCERVIAGVHGAARTL